jgi:hypothetical protein
MEKLDKPKIQNKELKDLLMILDGKKMIHKKFGVLDLKM